MKALHTTSARLLPLPILALLAACIPPAPEPTPAPSPAQVTRPSPPPAPPPVPAPTNWIDAAQTPGDWQYRQETSGSVAMFGTPASEARFTLTCDRNARQISISRPGPAGSVTNMVIHTETASRSLAARPLAGAQPMLAANLSASDPLLDAIALTRGRFAIETGGLPTLYLPAWGEVTRVIEDCR